MAEISAALYCLPRNRTWTSPLLASDILYGNRLVASSTWRLLNFRPISRLIEKIVCSGFVMAWRFAICPTRRSPLSVMATTEGVVRLPSELAITTGSPPLMMETQEFVVPKSIPMTLPMEALLPEIFISLHQPVVRQGLQEPHESQRPQSPKHPPRRVLEE